MKKYEAQFTIRIKYKAKDNYDASRRLENVKNNLYKKMGKWQWYLMASNVVGVERLTDFLRVMKGYAVGEHPTQKAILKLAKKQSLKGLGLRRIGKLIGVNHPQKVKHHLMRLVKNGLLKEK